MAKIFPIKNLLVNWSKKNLNLVPEKDDDSFKIEFEYKVGKKYPVDCTVSARDGIGILSLVSRAYLNIPDDRAAEILEFSNENNAGIGSFVINNGWIIFIYAKSNEDGFLNNGTIDAMIENMDEAFLKIIPGLLSKLNL